MKIGAQFYTIRKSCTTPGDLAASMRRVAGLGYKYIQLSAVCPYDAGWMAERLSEFGLGCALTHTAYDRITGETDAVIAEHKRIGCSYIGLGMMPGVKNFPGMKSCYEDFRANIAPAIAKIKAAGMLLMYHNHAYEFAEYSRGVSILEQMCVDFAPDELGVTLDSYWAAAAGWDPARLAARLSGRIACVHLKDMRYDGTSREVRMAPVGEGNIDWGAFIAAAEAAGSEYAFVEQDDCYGEDPFECLGRSLRFLAGMERLNQE